MFATSVDLPVYRVDLPPEKCADAQRIIHDGLESAARQRAMLSIRLQTGVCLLPAVEIGREGAVVEFVGVNDNRSVLKPLKGARHSFLNFSSVRGEIILRHLVLDGFSCNGGTGGTLFVGNDASANIQNCTVKNSVALNGGGIGFATRTTALISDTIFTNVTALADGGALFFGIKANVTILSSSLVGHAQGGGGGVHLDNHARLTVHDSQLSRSFSTAVWRCN
jgi:hypothetical protein